MKQRYKLANSLIALLRTHELKVPVSVLLNPTGADVRNLVLGLLSKSENTKGNKESTKTLTFEEKIAFTIKKLNKSIISEFIDSEWIHPKLRTLRTTRRVKGYRFGGINPGFKQEDGENITSQIQEGFPTAKYIIQ